MADALAVKGEHPLQPAHPCIKHTVKSWISWHSRTIKAANWQQRHSQLPGVVRLSVQLHMHRAARPQWFSLWHLARGLARQKPTTTPTLSPHTHRQVREYLLEPADNTEGYRGNHQARLKIIEAQ
eukprot:1161542-Pelagomonas_calceolata.AAC.8